MLKGGISAGLLGGVVLILWTVFVNTIFGFQARIEMKQIRAELEVYETLKAQIVEPGRSICSPVTGQDPLRHGIKYATLDVTSQIS